MTLPGILAAGMFRWWQIFPLLGIIGAIIFWVWYRKQQQ